MKKAYPLIALFLCIGIGNLAAQTSNEVSIIPQPVKLEQKSGNFTVNNKTIIVVESADAESIRVANMMAERFKTSAGHSIKVSEVKKFSPQKNVILFTSAKADPDLGSEGYQLSVSTKAVVLRASGPAGFFYGMQTIFQLLPAEIYGSFPTAIAWQIPGVEIVDKPRFEWPWLAITAKLNSACCSHQNFKLPWVRNSD